VNLAEIRALLKRAGISRSESIDRVAVKYDAGKPIGIDVMLTAGGVTYIPVEE